MQVPRRSRYSTFSLVSTVSMQHPFALSEEENCKYYQEQKTPYKYNYSGTTYALVELVAKGVSGLSCSHEQGTSTESPQETLNLCCTYQCQLEFNCYQKSISQEGQGVAKH